MTKKHSTKRSLIASILVLCLFITSFVGTTFAWFTDSVTSSGNKIVSGSLKVDLELLDKKSGNWNSLKDNHDPIFTYENWEPGYIDAKILKVDNEGSLALKWKAKFTSTNELGELANVIDVYVLPYGVLTAEDAATKVAYPTRELKDYTLVGTLSEFVNTIESTTYGNLLAGESAYLGIALKMQESAGNEYQEKTIGTFDIQIVATQMAHENDSFGNDYDAGAEFEGEITNAQGLAAAVASGGSYTLLNDITLDQAAEVAAGTELVIDLNGNTISSGDDGYAIVNAEGGSVIIKDSKASSNTVTYARNVSAGGEIRGIVFNGEGGTMLIEGGIFTALEKWAILNEGGSLVINSATINGTDKSYPLYSYNAGHSLVLNDVTVNGVFGCVNVYGEGTVEINGGTYTMTGVAGKTSHIMFVSSGTVATINDGYFAHVGDISMSAASGGGVCVYGSGKLTINGGSFSGDYADIYNWGGSNSSLKVNGGTFTFKLPNGTLAEGSTTIDGEDGAIIVVDKELTKLANGIYIDEKSTANDYYISNAEGLAYLNTIMANKTAGRDAIVNLVADIDFTGKVWTPVDSHADAPFELAELNGNGHTIYNLTINGQAMFTRFAGFGDVVIKDITFDGANVNSNGNINTSILTVQTYQNVLLDNVDVKNSTIIGGYKVAPLIATVYNESTSTITATLKNCDVENVVVKATSYDFCTTGMVAFVYAADNDKIEFENCTVTDVALYAPNVYTAHAAVYTTGSNTLFDEVPGVIVTNVTFENIK